MEEKLDFLIKYLINDIDRDIFEEPVTLEEKEKVWRGLCNIREPKPISEEYLKVQDDYLQERLKSVEITLSKDLPTVGQIYSNSKLKYKDKMVLWKGNITQLKIDCIVNAANSKGLGCFQPMHNCIDNQIQTYSGVQMRLECFEYMKNANYDLGLPTGEAFITKGYNLPCKYVIHTVGPVVDDKVTEKNDIEIMKQFNTCDIMSITNLENERKELYDNLKDITKRKEILKYYSKNNDKFYRFFKYFIAPLLCFGLIFLFTLIFKMPWGNRINLSILSFLNSIGTAFYRDTIDKKVIKSLYNNESISIKQCNAEIVNLEYKLIPIMHKIVDTEYKVIKINELSNNDKTNINSKSTIISKIYSETSKELDMPNRSKIYKKYENI